MGAGCNLRRTVRDLNKNRLSNKYTYYARILNYVYIKSCVLNYNLLTEHGRATPLLWKTVNKSTIKNNRARYEDQILSKLKEIVPSAVRVTILADRGFADQLFFKFISEQLGFFYIIRTRSNINISNQIAHQALRATHH